jgi:hypothetical protein
MVAVGSLGCEDRVSTSESSEAGSETTGGTTTDPRRPTSTRGSETGEPTSGGLTTGEIDTGGPADTDTSAGELPAECFETDPAVDASFVLEHPDWDAGGSADISVDCTVDAVLDDGITLRTEMTCDDGGIGQAVALEVASPFSDDPTWAADSAVHLRATRYEQNELAGAYTEIVRLERGPSNLLVFAFDGGALEGPLLPDAEWYRPIALEIDTSLCGGHPDLVEPPPQQLLRGDIGDCCSGEVRGGNRALFDLSGAYTGFDVDAARVEVGVVGGGGDGNTDHFSVVIRAVDTPI